MRLEKLVVQGFKSFADRLQFTFGPGITAIVGPNGSGKSNVVDAIRWVLGEQSLHNLRGERLEDIIFSGSNFRRPHGLAEVSLTFNNETGVLPVSYSEVTVTRRAYRSGNSEFLINGVPCRLRDIQDLFADTGIGKEGYAFIGQGKVDEVLNLSPEQRRIFLEQAAGVWKWRRRKKETQDKLARTEQDLLRIRDVCAELERQIGPLEEEARRANKYKVKSQRLRQLQIFVSLSEIRRLEERIAAFRERYVPEKQQLQTLSKKREMLEVDLEHKREAVDLQENLLDALKSRQNEWQQRLATLDKHLTTLVADNRERAVRKEAANTQSQELAERLAELSTQQSQVQDELLTLATLLSAKEGEVVALTEKLQQLENEQDKIQSTLSKRREQTIAYLSERSAESNALRSLIREQQGLIERRQRALVAAHEAQTRLADMNQRLKEEEEKIQQLEETLRIIDQERQRLEGQLMAARTQEKKMGQDRDNMWRRLERLKAELSGLEGLKQSFSYYQPGARSVLSAGRTGILGAVAQLLVVPSDYETAIDVALGASQQFLVATDDQSAAAAIDWLRQTGQGRATFLPLNTIRPQIPSLKEQELIKKDNVVGWAADLVQYPPSVAVAVKHLLARVLIVRDLTTARVIAKAGGFRFKVVTLAGDVVSPGGSITGGSLRERRPSQIAEERRLRELKQTVAIEEKAFRNQTDAIRQMTENRQRIQEQFDQLIENMRQKQDELALARSKKQEYTASAKEMAHNQMVWEEEEQALANRLQELATEKEQRLEAKQVAENKLEHWEILTAEEEKHQQDLAVQVEKIREAVLTARVELVSLQEKHKQLDMRGNELGAMLAHVQQLQQEVSDKLGEIVQQEENARRELKELEAEKTKITIELAATTDEGQRIGQTLYNLRQNLQDEERKLTLLRKQEEEQRTKVHSWELNFSRLESAYTAAKEKLFENYSVPPDSPLPDLDLKPAQAQSEIQDLTQDIASLGEVNLKAPQTLAELKQRQQFLTAQAKDVQAAKESLQKLISDIDKTVSSRLLEIFDQLRDNFRFIFQQLFAGGQADLKLTSDDPNEAGLEIFAQLPGKKMQPLTLLSGGERALTAIAFLFALLRCGSSTLCVLDEIDAPLDEVNAERFLCYLEELAQETQFILVTHRKQAMIRAQALYGLAMTPGGVTSLVSVDMKQAAG